jgi:hypothetical protein
MQRRVEDILRTLTGERRVIVTKNQYDLHVRREGDLPDSRTLAEAGLDWPYWANRLGLWLPEQLMEYAASEIRRIARALHPGIAPNPGEYEIYSDIGAPNANHLRNNIAGGWPGVVAHLTPELRVESRGYYYAESDRRQAEADRQIERQMRQALAAAEQARMERLGQDGINVLPTPKTVRAYCRGQWRTAVAWEVR